MRIGIVGAGAAGLCAAWLLDEEHEVTVFEQAERPGGHAQTVEVEQPAGRASIDAGFEFFSGGMYPTFSRLLSLLNIPLRQYPLTATFYTADNRYACLLPPLRDGRVVWSALRPRQVLHLLQLAFALRRAGPLIHGRDTSVTVEKYLASLPVASSFKRDFLLPFLLAGWCVAPEEFQSFIAYDVLSYAYRHRPTGPAPYLWTEVEGGTQTYVRALIKSLTRAVVRSGCPIVRLTQSGPTYRLQTADGAAYDFDNVIIATDARSASRLMAEVAGVEDIRSVLTRIEYFPTRIAIHGDVRLMPADRRHWSVVNTRYDGRYSANTIWKAWKSSKPIFRSWVTFEPQLPEPIYALAQFEHAKVNAAYFDAQPRLAASQGRQGLWLAGTYLQDIDSHESAILSAVNIARRLAPTSARHQQLVGASHPGSP